MGTLELCRGRDRGQADAVLAASVFHFGTFSIRQVKEYMASQAYSREIGFLNGASDNCVRAQIRRQRGLIPCVVQQYDTGEVLMVAWMNEESVG